MWDIALEFKALLIFAEHRYYGKSLPYGKKSLKVSKIFCSPLYLLRQSLSSENEP